jgi:Fe-S oxidoreductase
MSNKRPAFIPPGLAYIADNINSKDNILGLPSIDKARWASGITFSHDRSTVFFAGCGYQYSAMLEPLVKLVRSADKMSINPDLPVVLAGIPKKMGIDAARLFTTAMSRKESSDADVLRDAVTVLKAAGIEPGYLGKDEPCCGAPLYHTGLQREFNEVAHHAYKRFKSHGVKKIISLVPSCTHALRNLAAKEIAGHDIEVKHFIEVVDENLGKLDLKYPHKVKVTYHDPCQLGRYMGLIEQPRRVLRAIGNVELVEPQWTSGEWSTCCGGGGGFEVVFPDMSLTLATNRVSELAATGADIIVTHCPGCLMQLKSGLKALKKDKIEVLDLATLISRSLRELNTK